MNRKSASEFDQELLNLHEGKNHGFHNDITPRHDEEAAPLAWQRTLDFFIQTLR